MASLEELLAEVDAWFAEELQCAPVSHLTETYNQVHAAWQSLRNRLSVAVSGEPLTPPAPPEEPAGLSESLSAAEEPEAGLGSSGTPGAPDGSFKAPKSSKAGS